tara:strand:+ start:108 stop:803 length:696 start_codon:yes stop_codon:yes gene_type:complete
MEEGTTVTELKLKRRIEWRKMNVYQKINVVMSGISYVQKTGNVPMGKKSYNAVLHDHVTKLVQPYFVDVGIIAIPKVIEHEFSRYTVTNKYGDSDRYQTDMKVELTIINIDEPEERITVTAVAQGLDPSDKGPGKAYSMAVKYCYLKLLMLESGDQEEDRVEEAKIKEKEHKANKGVRDEAAAKEKADLCETLIKLLKENNKYAEGKTEGHLEAMSNKQILDRIKIYAALA